ncbi:hypothetical protein GBA52_006221 [Prunus armeniaca]|nr:hypothetical protein GBA52_006221 [Prunus armeniaca]
MEIECMVMRGGLPNQWFKSGTHQCHARSTIADGGSPAASTPVLSLALASQSQSAVCLALMGRCLIASDLRLRHVYVYVCLWRGEASLPPLHLCRIFHLVGLLWLMWLALMGLAGLSLSIG